MAQAENLGTGGSVLNAQYGSAPTTNGNAPLLLDHAGTNYLYLPGLAGNYASTATSAALQITGNIEIVMRFSLDSYNLGATEQMLRYDDSCWIIVAANQLRLSIRLAAGPQFTIAVATLPFSNGQGGWIRMRRTAATGVVQFAYAFDSPTEPTSWTNLATTGPQPAGNLFYTGAVPVYTGSVFDPAGKFYRHIVRNGFGGTVVYDANFTTGITSGGQTSFIESSTNAAIVTINRSTSGRKAVAVVRDVWLLGLDDYFTVANNALVNFGASQDFTVLAVGRQWGTSATYPNFVEKGNPGASIVGYLLLRNLSTSEMLMGIYDGVTPVAVGGINQTSGQAFTISGGRSSATIFMQLDNTSRVTAPSPTGSLTNNAEDLNFGTAADMEAFGFAVWRRALTQAEIAAIASYYGT